MKAPLIAAALLAATTAAAATPPQTPATPPTPAPLPCAQGFDPLIAAAKALPGATPVATRPGMPLEAISVQAGGELTIYNYTVPTHPAHPYVARRRTVQQGGRVSIDMSTCGYGDKAAGEALKIQFERMNEAFVRQVSSPPATPPTK